MISKIKDVISNNVFPQYINPFEGYVEKPFYGPFLTYSFKAIEIQSLKFEDYKQILMVSYVFRFLNQSAQK